MTRIRKQVSAVVALTALASCSTTNPPVPTGASRTTTTTTAATASTTAAGPDYTVVGLTNLYGPARWALPAAGDTKAPLAVFNVTAGYQGKEDFVWVNDETDLAEYPGQVLYRAVSRVFNDPCDVTAPSPRMGATVEDLARALVAQKRTNTTAPVPVSLGGYHGVYLELTTAKGFETCGPTGEMIVWESGADSQRPFWPVPTTERYWILDVQGHRVMVTAMTPSGAGPESVRRVTDVAKGVTFVTPAP